jgi:NADH-quinone oxidoreductase subunit N
MDSLIAIIALGVFCLIAEIFNFRKAIIPVSIVGLLAVLGYSWYSYTGDASYYNNMIVVNKFSLSFSTLFILLTVFIIALGSDFYKDHPTKFSDYIAIKIFLLTGAFVWFHLGI